jgi:hypothetical protein
MGNVWHKQRESDTHRATENAVEKEHFKSPLVGKSFPKTDMRDPPKMDQAWGRTWVITLGKITLTSNA